MKRFIALFLRRRKSYLQNLPLSQRGLRLLKNVYENKAQNEAYISTDNLNHSQIHYVNEALTGLVYQKVLRPGDHALDIGASVGNHARVMSALVGDSGNVHAFEPNVDHFHSLTSIGKNLRLWPCAVGDRLSMQRLHIPKGLDGWASLQDIRNELSDRDFTLLATTQVRIDDLLDEIDASRVSFIKLDVERREEQAIIGMAELLNRSRAVMVLENPTSKIAEVLAQAQYGLLDFNGRMCVPENPWLPNVVAIPLERQSQSREWLPSREEIARTISEAGHMGG